LRIVGSTENLVLGGICGGLTFVAIFLIGLVSGVSLGLLFLRGLLYGLLLALLGTGLGILLERLVPGVWESSGGTADGGEGGFQGSEEYGGGNEPGRTFEYTVGADEAGTANPVSEIRTVDAEDAEDADSAAGEADGRTGSGGGSVAPGQHVPRSVAGESRVVGNFRFIDDKQFPNDPEDYAKAIRTMMSRDD